MIKQKRNKNRAYARKKIILGVIALITLVALMAQTVVLRYELDNLKKFVDDSYMSQVNEKFSQGYMRPSSSGTNGVMTFPELKLQAPEDIETLNTVRYRPTVVTDTTQAALITDTTHVFTYKVGKCLNLYTIEVFKKDSSFIEKQAAVFLKQLSDGRTMKIYDNTAVCAKDYSDKSVKDVLEFLKALQSY